MAYWLCGSHLACYVLSLSILVLYLFLPELVLNFCLVLYLERSSHIREACSQSPCFRIRVILSSFLSESIEESKLGICFSRRLPELSRYLTFGHRLGLDFFWRALWWVLLRKVFFPEGKKLRLRLLLWWIPLIGRATKTGLLQSASSIFSNACCWASSHTTGCLPAWSRSLNGFDRNCLIFFLLVGTENYILLRFSSYLVVFSHCRQCDPGSQPPVARIGIYLARKVGVV